MFTWIPTYLKKERDLTIVGTSGYLFVVIAGAFLGYLCAGWVHDRLGRRRAFALFAALAGVVAGRVLRGPVGLEHDAAARRLPAGVLRLRLLLGLRLLPGRAVPDAGPRDRRGLLLQRRPRHRGAVPGHHRLPRGGRRARRGDRVRRLRLRARDAGPDGAARDPRARDPGGRVSSLDALRGARAYDLEQPRFAGAPVWPAHEPGVILNLHRRHERDAPESRTSASAMLVMTEHSGTHIDALCHQAYDGADARRRRGHRARADARPASRALGIDTVAPIVAPRRAARRRPRPAGCPTATRVTAADLEAAAAGLELRPRRRRPRPARLGRPVGRPRRPTWRRAGSPPTPRAGSPTRSPFAVGADNVAWDIPRRARPRARLAPRPHDPDRPGGHPHHRVALPRGARRRRRARVRLRLPAAEAAGRHRFPGPPHRARLRTSLISAPCGRLDGHATWGRPLYLQAGTGTAVPGARRGSWR